MGWFESIFGVIVNPITEVVKGYQQRKTIEIELEGKILDRQHELNLKKMDIASELAKQGIQTEADWDSRAQIAMSTSWKDEYLLVLFSIPLILAFFPKTQETVLQGFAVLQQTPDWYMLMISGIVAATFGLRWLLSKK